MDSVQLLSDYALSLIRGYQEDKEVKWVRRDGSWHRALPEVGDHCWFLGDERWGLQGELVITVVKNELGQVIVKPIENKESSFNGWAVWWKDITYDEPKLPEEYLYG